MTSKKQVPIKGSERSPIANAHISGPVDPNERIQVTIMIRRKSTGKGIDPVIQNISAGRPAERKYLTREELASAYGADPEDIKKVEDFAHEHGIDVVEESPAQRRIVVSGTLAALSAAFGVYLAHYETPTGSYRGRTGPVHIPEELASIVVGVFGLDNRPQAKPHFRVINESILPQKSTKPSSFTPIQVGQLYDFPSGNGTGQCIAIIELGGGYKTSDLNAYFAKLGVKKPRVTSIAVDHGTQDGGSNSPTGDPNGPDGEVMLDIEVAGSIASGANIAVYFAGNTDKGFIDAILNAVHDTNHKPSVISISWGSPEINWTSQAMQAMDQAFQDAAAVGVTVCVASGDSGSSDIMSQQQNDGLLHVNFPASSSYALGCGGTKLTGSGSHISNEVVWNEGEKGGASGGGVSDVFSLPAWQASAGVPPSANPGHHVGRGVPDVAGDADPVSGYQILVDGQWAVFGGTSAVAPLWAALIAILNQNMGTPAGYLNPVLYKLPVSSGAFHDITSGNNNVSSSSGAYKAGKGWDACTGLGSPDGSKLLTSLKAKPVVAIARASIKSHAK